MATANCDRHFRVLRPSQMFSPVILSTTKLGWVAGWGEGPLVISAPNFHCLEFIMFASGDIFVAWLAKEEKNGTKPRKVIFARVFQSSRCSQIIVSFRLLRGLQSSLRSCGFCRVGIICGHNLSVFPHRNIPFT